ncbi:MAG: hypothetical protein ACYDHH_17575 [Solirubrobacteraceae bacterium]
MRASNAAGTSLPVDSAPTSVVQPLVIRARFTISPNPTCTGLPVTLDASISKTPNSPITRYRFIEQSVGYPDTFPATYPDEHPWLIADGVSPRATASFGYDYAFPQTPSHLLDGVFFADPRLITLTVTDGTGASASYSDTVYFDPGFSNKSRVKCGGRRVRAGRVPVHDITLKVTKTLVTARIPCTPFADCSGTLQLLARSSRSLHRAKSASVATSAKPLVIASSAFFFVPAHRAANVPAKLTSAGRALVARGNPLTAIAQLMTVSPTGHKTTQSFTATLIGKRKRR